MIPKIYTMLRKFLLSFIFVSAAFFLSEEASAQSCWFYCPSQQSIIGYQPYPYYTPRLTYDLHYGYAPIYAGMGYGGGYGGGPYGSSPYGRGYGPYFGTGYGNNGGYNPNWYNQNFPFSYPRGLVNLSPRSGGSSSYDRGYTSVSTPSRREPPKPEPSVIPPPPKEPERPVEDCLPAPGPLKPPEPDVVILEPVPTLTPPRDRSGDCLPGQEQNCTPAVTAGIGPDAETARPVDLGTGCPAGHVPNPAKSGGCTPCNGEGNVIVGDRCECGAEYSVEDQNDGSAKCVKCGANEIYTKKGCECTTGLTRNSAGVCTASQEGGITPCAPGDSCYVAPEERLCQNKKMKDLAFNCECKPGTDLYGAGEEPSFLQIIKNVGDNDEIAKCVYYSMKGKYSKDMKGANPYNKSNYAYCNGEKQTITQEPPCFTPEYHAITTQSYLFASKCFGLQEKELLAMLSQESNFQVNIIGGDKLSIGAGQLTFSGALGDISYGRTSQYSDLINTQVKDEKCKAEITKYVNELSAKKGSIKDQAREAKKANGKPNYCEVVDPVENPYKSMLLAALYYSKEKDRANAIYSQTCANGSKVSDLFKNREEFEKHLSSFTITRYNSGDEIRTMLCSLAEIAKSGSPNAGRYKGASLTKTNDDFAVDGNPPGRFWQLAKHYYTVYLPNKKKNPVRGFTDSHYKVLHDRARALSNKIDPTGNVKCYQE
ncbi:MAG: hypothetical protein KDD37_05105 [Bdellovibrionales bacterium]|nr:hypothetical protein [Bdellovibrionales bacterium]